MNDDSGDLVPSSWLDDDDESNEDSGETSVEESGDVASARLAALAAAARTSSDKPDAASEADKPDFDLASLARKKRTPVSANETPAETSATVTDAVRPEARKAPAPAAKKTKEPGKSASRKPRPSAEKPSPTATPSKTDTTDTKSDKGDKDTKGTKSDTSDKGDKATSTKAGPVDRGDTKKATARREPAAAKPAADAPRPPSSSVGRSPALLVGLGLLAIAALAVVLWLAVRGGSSSPDVSQPDSIDGVTLQIDTCGLDGATATISNRGEQTMEFDAGIDFVDESDTPVYPVRIAVNLEPGATRSVQVPFGGTAPPGGVRCVGTLRNVVAAP